MTLAFTGGRNYQLTDRDKDLIFRMIEDYEITHFSIGDAKGLDSEVFQFIINNGRYNETKRFYANWNRYGKQAGPIRNMEMLKESNMLLAFPGGKGTESAIKTAHGLGIPVYSSALLLKEYIDV